MTRPHWLPKGSGPVGGRVRNDRDEWLDRMAVRGLYRIILSAILSIAALSMTGLLLRGSSSTRTVWRSATQTRP